MGELEQSAATVVAPVFVETIAAEQTFESDSVTIVASVVLVVAALVSGSLETEMSALNVLAFEIE